MGVTKAQYIDATMDCMEKGCIFNTRYELFFDAAANVVQDDRWREVCAWNKHVRLQEQTENGWLLSLMCDFE